MGAEVDWDMYDEDGDTYGDNGYDEPQGQLAICDGDAEEDLDVDDELRATSLCTVPTSPKVSDTGTRCYQTRTHFTRISA